MTFKEFITNPITIIVGLLASAGILSIYGYKNWGWFGGSDSSNSSQTPWAGCKRIDGRKETVYDTVKVGVGDENIYNPDGTIYEKTIAPNQLLGFLVGTECDWIIFEASDGEKYINKRHGYIGEPVVKPTDRIIDFATNRNLGLSDAPSAGRQSFAPPTQNPYGYKLCYTRVATLNKGSEPLNVWQDRVRKTFQEIRDKINQAHAMGYQIAIVINAPLIIPTAPVGFYVYAGDCNSQIAKEVINYIQNLH